MAQNPQPQFRNRDIFLKPILYLLFIYSNAVFGQEIIIDQEKPSYVVGWFHNQDQVTNGLSFGIYSYPIQHRNSLTNGMRIEILGTGIVKFFFWGEVDISKKIDYTYSMWWSEFVNGISFSTLGTWGNMNFNGVSLNGFGCEINKGNGFLFSGITSNADRLNGVSLGVMANYIKKLNGVSISGLINYVHTGNGMQLCSISNKSRFFNGMQISIYNKVKSGRLIQLGLINYIKDNPKGLRILPFVNMRFKKKEEKIAQ